VKPWSTTVQLLLHFTAQHQLLNSPLKDVFKQSKATFQDCWWQV